MEAAIADPQPQRIHELGLTVIVEPAEANIEYVANRKGV